MGGGCNSCKLLPEEKLKIDSAIIPPFNIGADTDINNSENIWFFDSNSTINTTGHYSLANLLIGNKSTINSQSYLNLGCIHAGYRTTMNMPPDDVGTGVISDGVVTTGSLANCYTGSVSGNNNSWTVAFRNFTVFGFSSVIWDHSVKKELETGTPFKWDAEKANRGILNQGILTTGYCSDLFIRCANSGIVLQGGSSTVQCYNNNGVIISGCPNDYPEKVENDFNSELKDKLREHKIQTVVEGPGIFISGYKRKVNLTDNKITVNSSLIQGSTKSSLPTKLKGYFRLDDFFQLKDKDGTILIDSGKLKQIINTVNELKEKVDKLDV